MTSILGLAGVQEMRSCTAHLPHTLALGPFIRQVHITRCRRREVPCRPQATASPPLSPSGDHDTDGGSTLPPPIKADWRDIDKAAVEETASWFRQTYNLKAQMSVVREKVRRAAVAVRDIGAPPLSLQGSILPKAEMLDSFSPGLGWTIFSRYPENFSHPDAEDLWRNMAALLQTTGFEPETISEIFSNHPPLFARTVKDPGNIKLLFEWFQHIGLEQDGAFKVINKYPLLLQTSVEETLKPRLAYLVNELGVPPAAAVAAFRNTPEILKSKSSSIQKRVDYLLDLGLTMSDVAKVYIKKPRVLTLHIEETLQPVVDFLQHDLGCSGKLLRRMIISSGLLERAPETIRHRAAIWAQLGVGPDLLRVALQRYPQLLIKPIDQPRYKKKLEFLREELGLEPTSLILFPQYVSLSLPGRVAPRCAAVKALKGEIISLFSLRLKDELFLKRYGISQDEYDAFLVEFKNSDEARRWQEVE